jgi:polyphenol oxidase
MNMLCTASQISYEAYWKNDTLVSLSCTTYAPNDSLIFKHKFSENRCFTEKIMQRLKFQGIEWLEFDLLADLPRVTHAVFLRHGGHSQGPFASLNADFDIGDDPTHVRLNLDLIQNQLKNQVPHWKHLTCGQAFHGNLIALVTERSTQEEIHQDGLMTAIPGITLMMTHADCQIALFYDPCLHVVANVHAGWRGSVANIYAEAIQRMHRVFGCQPSNLLVCISPSLGPDEAEFIHYRSELPQEFWPFQVRPNYFDFWSISEYQLQAAGILPHHIEIARLSTYGNPRDFFCYRRDKITGRHSTCITLNLSQ